MRKLIAGVVLALGVAAMGFAADGSTLQGPDLAAALRQGGFVIVMRHTSSPRELPQGADVAADNVNGERQLDAQGRSDAQALGAALRRLQIPVAEVLSSPTYRAHETARLAGLDAVTSHDELSNEGMGAAAERQAAFLRELVARAPAAGNTLVITHGPNLNAAFAEFARGMGEGDALVFDPRAAGASPAGRIAIGEWPAL